MIKIVCLLKIIAPVANTIVIIAPVLERKV